MKKILRNAITTVMVLMPNLILCTVSSAETLSNSKINARFNNRGLLSVHDLPLNKTLELGDDHWAIEIDGVTIDSSGLNPKKFSQDQNSLNYRSRSRKFNIFQKNQ